MDETQQTQEQAVATETPALTKQLLQTSGVIKNVAKYFMTFLETNFQKRRVPKRNTNSMAVKGNRVGFDLERYPELKKLIIRNFGKTGDELKLSVKPGQFTSSIPQTLMAFIDERIEGVDVETITAINTDIIKSYSEARSEHSDNFEEFLADVKEATRQAFQSHLVAELIEDVKKPLKNAGVSEQSGLHQLQSDITDHLFELLEESIDTLGAKYYAAKEAKPVLDEARRDCHEIITAESVKAVLKRDFDDFATHDCYKDLYQLSSSLKLLDKTELYLYLFDLEINLENRDRFPLFYVPVHMVQAESEYILTCDTRAFVNSKALEYVCQEFGAKTNQNVAPDKFDRILYAESDDSLRDRIEHILRRVVQFLDLDDELDLKSASLKVSSNAHVSLSNAVSFYVFDKSDEALINDYEQILNDEGEISALFAELLKSFLTQNPIRFDDDIDRSWDDMDIPDKLLTESPIPLNEEQKKVVMALDNDDCKVLILEGPPGTGKSHTITSVICRAVLEGKSVLVLSDKKEALDVVEDKISTSLNKVRVNEDFQNPILRLGAMGKGIGKVVDGAVLNAIKHHYSTYRSSEQEIDKQYQELTAQTKDELNINTSYFADLSLDDLKEYFEWANDFEQYAILFEGFEKPLDRENVTEALDGLTFLRDAANHDSKVIQLAKLFPGLDALSEIESKYSVYLRALHDADRPALAAVDRALEIGVPFADVEKLATLADQVKADAATDLGQVVINLDNGQKFEEMSYQLSFTQGAISAASKIFEYLAPANHSDLGTLYTNVASEVAAHPKQALTALSDFLLSLQSLKSPVIGFAGKRGRIDELTLNFRKVVPGFQLANPEKYLSDLLALKSALEYATGLIAENYEDDEAILSSAVLLCAYEVVDIHHRDVASGMAETIVALINMSEKTKNAFDKLKLEATGKILAAVGLEKQRQELVAEAKPHMAFLAALTPQIDTTKPIEVAYIGTALGELNEHDADRIEKASEIVAWLDGASTGVRYLIRRLDVTPELDNIADCKSPLLDFSVDQRDALFAFVDKRSELTQLFKDAPADSYLDEQSTIEYYNTAKMAYTLDKHILDYTTTKAAELQTLRGLLKNKQQFPKSLFENLKQAFPCILAGIRDYAEYIPLQKDLFDLIIIDEASQVSIAQALPAFIRGKKILILGDDKQFSNVKAGNASNERNTFFRTELMAAFRKENEGLEDIVIPEQKIRDNFDIKRSVLDFTRSMSNYVIQLKKHFRCYPEIISYSNENFYNNSLECVKLRTVPISEVIKFDVLEHDDREEKFAKTNTLEAQFILDTLQSWHDKSEKKSVGIITPHGEQARIIAETLQGSDIWPWLEKDCQIKIMTFDTCQGEERDYIFYSMVASPVADRLAWIFAADFDSLGAHTEHLNAQRLNVGFSRAKDTIHFVLSKPIAEFKGEIQAALKHYETKLNTAGNVHIGDTDERSGMEPKVQQWLYQTKFYQEHPDLEIRPQFPIGEYLSYIDPNYHHPGYKVDFLLVLGDNTIILEYDGFKEHFDNLSEVDATNYRSYQKPADYYRQKVLESYGYRFLRVNKFNLGEDPVVSLNDLLVEKFKKKSSRPHSLTS